MIVRPTADIASFPAPGWTTSPLFSKVNSEEPDDSTFITSLAPGAEDPQVAFAIGDLEIPDGAQGQIKLRFRGRWSAAPTASPTVRVGLGLAANLAVDNPTLEFSKTLTYEGVDFVETEVVFNYSDWGQGDSSLFGFYLEATPDSADAITFDLAWVEVESCRPNLIIERCPHGTLTGEDVIKEARDLSPSFESRKHPDGMLLRQLSTFEKEVANRLARVNPAMFMSYVVVNLPLENFGAGIELPQFTYVAPGIELISSATGGGIPVNQEAELVNFTLRNRQADYCGRVGFLQGRRLYLSGSERSWQGLVSLRINLILTPDELPDLKTPLALPNYCNDLYVGRLVAIMAIREGDEARAAIANNMMESVWATVAQQKAAESFVTVDAWPGGY